jgi:hypothetical protein
MWASWALKIAQGDIPGFSGLGWGHRPRAPGSGALLPNDRRNYWSAFASAASIAAATSAAPATPRGSLPLGQ